ncbi:MAG: hypothetical protein CL908_05310 [Deltaproteobacteria bacterium]|nr:hypothetical protein [Deltaproteobacteria bacterium]
MIHSAPEFVELTPEMKERLDSFRDENEPTAKLGDVASRVIFEDDHLRIWEMILEPGEASDLHQHDLDYYLVISEGDYVAGVTLEDDPVDSFLSKVPESGNTVFVPKGGTEWAYNVGKETFREILIERKNS